MLIVVILVIGIRGLGFCRLGIRLRGMSLLVGFMGTIILSVICLLIGLLWIMLGCLGMHMLVQVFMGGFMMLDWIMWMLVGMIMSGGWLVLEGLQ